MDCIIDDPYGKGTRTGVDVTVINTMSPSYISPSAAADATRPLRDAVDTKEKRHRAACGEAGYGYYTAGWTVFGGIFGDFYHELVKPHFKHQKAVAKRNGEDPWVVQARKERLLDRWSVVIARFNAKAIRGAVWRGGADDWPSTPERDDDLWDIDAGGPMGSEGAAA